MSRELKRNERVIRLTSADTEELAYRTAEIDRRWTEVASVEVKSRDFEAVLVRPSLLCQPAS